MIRVSRSLLPLMLATTVVLAWPSGVAAQRSAPRGSTTVGVAVPRTSYPGRYHRPYYYPRYYAPYYYPYYSRYYYSPWYYGPYYSGFGFGLGFGWPGAYWGSYGYYGYPYAYGYPYYAYDDTGSARLQITPRNAQVYVDGRFAGLVDEFDGSLQRLHVGVGEHELQVYLEGYRTLTQKILFTRGTTVKIEGALQPLGPGEAPAPKPAVAAETEDRYPAPPARTGESGEFGTLSVRVNPADAVILIDGEPWDRPEASDRFSIELAEGPHRVEIRKEGHRPYIRTVDVRRGRTFTLNVSMTP